MGTVLIVLLAMQGDNTGDVLLPW